MTKEKIIEMLSCADIFKNASKNTIEKLSKEKICSFSKGEIISSCKDAMKQIGVILSGTVLAEEKNSGSKVPLNTLKEGNVFGVTTLFSSDAEHVSCLVSKTKSEIMFIPEETIKRYILEDTGLNMAYIAFLTDRIRFLNKKISTFATPTTEHSLARFLLCQNADEIKVVAAKLSKQLNIGRSSLYRAISELQRIKAIDYQNGTIKILSREKLILK